MIQKKEIQDTFHESDCLFGTIRIGIIHFHIITINRFMFMQFYVHLARFSFPFLILLSLYVFITSNLQAEKGLDLGEDDELQTGRGREPRPYRNEAGIKCLGTASLDNLAETIYETTI